MTVVQSHLVSDDYKMGFKLEFSPAGERNKRTLQYKLIVKFIISFV